MLSLSQGHCQPLGDSDEHVCTTQYDKEADEDVMEVVQSVFNLYMKHVQIQQTQNVEALLQIHESN